MTTSQMFNLAGRESSGAREKFSSRRGSAGSSRGQPALDEPPVPPAPVSPFGAGSGSISDSQTSPFFPLPRTERSSYFPPRTMPRRRRNGGAGTTAGLAASATVSVEAEDQDSNSSYFSSQT